MHIEFSSILLTQSDGPSSHISYSSPLEEHSSMIQSGANGGNCSNDQNDEIVSKLSSAETVAMKKPSVQNETNHVEGKISKTLTEKNESVSKELEKRSSRRAKSNQKLENASLGKYNIYLLY